MRMAIVTGGETGEREISIRSAKNVASLIDFADTKTFVFPEDTQVFLESAKDFDLVIPMIHGAGGEDGSLQALLHNLNVPFIFSDIETHKIAIDKKRAKEMVGEISIISPQDVTDFPLFAKPRFGGSSVASRLCTSEEEFGGLVKSNPTIEFIKEEPIKGREFTVGIIGHKNNTFALPVIEIIPKGEFFDFENKYNPDKLATEICPAEIPEDLSKELQRQALEIHNYLKVKHLSRSDFIVTAKNQIYFLEINTIPGMTDTSLTPKMLNNAGLSLKELLKEWCLEETIQ